MDTLTHALSGALLARVIAARQKRLPDAAAAANTMQTANTGRFVAPWDGQPGAPAPWQCVAVGLVAGAFPDVDAVAQLFGPVAYLTYHRGITHSLLVLPLWAWLVAWVMSRCFAVTRQQRSGWKSLYLVALGGIAVHIAGDWITQFGTMLLQPVSDQRFGLGAMFIIDLVFTGLLLAGLVLAALLPARRWPAMLGLAGAVAWVGIAWVGHGEAMAVAQRKALALGVGPAAQVTVMPRPASPFNWTITLFDGQHYHVAHVNTRRTEPLEVTAQDNFVRRFSAPYVPERLATWEVVPRFGGPGTPAWVQNAWEHESFAFYRWFAQTPALFHTQESVNALGQIERCAWFRDLRFEFPGRDDGPFRYGVCLQGPDVTVATVRLYQWENGQRIAM